jgi:hypothetical protein
LLRLEYGTNAGSWVPVEYLRPYTPRIRPSKSDITKLKQEIAIRNEAIDRLENDVRILHSEKVRLGELNAHLQKRIETIQAAWGKDHEEYQTKRLQLEKQLSDFFIIMEKDQAQTALSLYIWKAVAVVAVVADLVLAFILLY